MQRDVTRVALAGIERAGFALSGSGAIREHGIINRPTEDVDLFTTVEHSSQFGGAVEQVASDLRQHGFAVEQVRKATVFARLEVTDATGLQTDVDLGVDWRAEDPVALAVGPVLSLPDSIGNKVSALYGRGEARDFLDVDAIRASGRISDEALLADMAERDPGFDVEAFAQQLRRVEQIQPAQVVRYGVTPTELRRVASRLCAWATQLTGSPEEPAEDRGRSAQELARRSFPRSADSHRTDDRSPEPPRGPNDVRRPRSRQDPGR